MTLPTVAVSIAASMSSGAIPTSAVITFTLNGADIDAASGEIVVPDTTTHALNANGDAVVYLWPNARGNQGTQYLVVIEDPVENTRISKHITVPDSACDLVTLLNFSAAPPAQQIAQLVGASTATPTSSSTVVGETGGVVKRFAKDSLGPFVNVKDPAYGAVGDGATDDTTAINAAVDALPSTGGTVYLPRGTYLHASKLTFSKRVRLVGEGPASINSTSASELLKKSTIAGNGVELAAAGITVEGVGFRGEVGNTGDGVVIKASRVTLRDVAVFQMGQDGIRIGTDSGGENCNLWLLEGVRAKSNGRHGIHVSEGAGALADANGGTAVHVDSQSNLSDGVYLGNCQLNTLVGVTCQNNGRYGIRFGQYAESNTVFGGDLEQSGLANIRFDSGANNNAIYCYTVLNATVSDASGTNPNRIEVIDANRLACGLTFPSTAIPSSNANTLDQYLEGTFTPVIVGATSAGTGTYTTQTGSYVKVGSLVTVQLYLVWTAHTGTGDMRIGGLPFSSASASTYSYASCQIGFASNIALTAGNVMTAYVNSGATTIDIAQYPTGGGAGSLVPIDTAGSIMLTVTYRAIE